MTTSAKGSSMASEPEISTGTSDASVLPVEQVRALVRLLYPEHMTPIAKRQIESACDAAEARHA